MRRIVIPAVILASLVAGCGGSGPGSSSGSQNPGAVISSTGENELQSVITGRVVSLDDKSPVAGAQVALGSATAMTNTNGDFRILLTGGTTVASLCSGGASTFRVALPDQGPGQTIPVNYQGAMQPSQEIPLSPEVLSGAESDLGVIAVVLPAADGGADAPPPPPVFEE